MIHSSIYNKLQMTTICKDSCICKLISIQHLTNSSLKSITTCCKLHAMECTQYTHFYVFTTNYAVSPQSNKWYGVFLMKSYYQTVFDKVTNRPWSYITSQWRGTNPYKCITMKNETHHAALIISYQYRFW